MDHSSLKDKLFEFYDGELNKSDRREMESHLNTCAECRGELDAWKQAGAQLFKPADAPASELFVAKVMDRIDELSPAGQINLWFSRLWQVPALAAAVAAILFIAAPQRLDPAVSTESLLLGETPAAISPAAYDELLGVSMEDL